MSISAFRSLFQLSHTASLNIGEARQNAIKRWTPIAASKSDALATAILRFCGLIEGCSRSSVDIEPVYCSDLELTPVVAPFHSSNPDVFRFISNDSSTPR